MAENLTAQIVETRNIHSRIVLYLLEGILGEAMSLMAAKRGRTVKSHFSHLHNVRLMWLKSAAPELLAELESSKMRKPASKVGLGIVSKPLASL